MRAFYIDDPTVTLPMEKLTKLGIEYMVLDADKYRTGELVELERFCEKRKYKNRDEITCAKGKIPQEKLDMFFEEHLHEDEEIRFVLDGSGYFDARDENDRWVRIHVVKNDLIIMPAGIYHRFSLDDNNCINALRLFQEEPKWTPINRGVEADEKPSRQDYITKFIVHQ